MATYLQLSELLEQPQFKRRVRFGLMVAALATLANAQASAPLKQYARQILAADIADADLRRTVLKCVLSTAVQAAGETVTDSDLQTIINTIFPDLI